MLIFGLFLHLSGPFWFLTQNQFHYWFLDLKNINAAVKTDILVHLNTWCVISNNAWTAISLSAAAA